MPLKIVSWNVNGIRAANKNGLRNWLEHEKPDILCLQEIKAFQNQFPDELVEWLSSNGYLVHTHAAIKPGYSGVAIFYKARVVKSKIDFREGLKDPTTLAEGRVLIAETPEFYLINAYFPNSQRDHKRLDYKLSFFKEMRELLHEINHKGKSFYLCGDFNVAHQEIDLKNPKSNHKTAGFLPEERAWMDTVVDQDGFIDVFRKLNPKLQGAYTWWSYRPGVREKNIGWRLDYFLTNLAGFKNVQECSLLPEVSGSDHCPVRLTISCELN